MRSRGKNAALSRASALAAMERLSAVTHLMSSLEYLARERDRQWGGLNNWGVARDGRPVRSRPLARVMDLVADRRVTRVVHIGRVVSAGSLLIPLPRPARFAADAALAVTSAALYPRHRYGADGSDQASFLATTVAAIARAGERQPAVVDACLWFAASQSVLSYTASGWAKLASPAWRSAGALTGVMRTKSYGDAAVWRFLHDHPRLTRALGHGVLALECFFPAIFAGRGRQARLLLGAMGAFHLVNARVMGLGRFVWSFTSMYPAVLYVTGPRERTARGRAVGGGAVRGGAARELREDAFPAVAGGLAAAMIGIAAAAQLRRRRRVLSGRPGECLLTTSAGNTLCYRRTGPADAAAVIVLESGLASTAEQWEWISLGLARRFAVVTYRRAGYGNSTYAGRRQAYALDEAVADLTDLVGHVADDRPVVLLGHSLGGQLALRSATRLPGRVHGIGLLDPSHPGQLRRSGQQPDGNDQLTRDLTLLARSNRLTLGVLARRPDWVERLPPDVRRLALDQYRDSRMWLAARREWRAAIDDAESSSARQQPPVTVPLLVVIAGLTGANDPGYATLQDELAATAPRADKHVIAGSDHHRLLTDADVAGRVVELTTAFIDSLDLGAHGR
jgi:pimeloyl-ACP methyl ester carboxylesterase